MRRFCEDLERDGCRIGKSVRARRPLRPHQHVDLVGARVVQVEPHSTVVGLAHLRGNRARGHHPARRQDNRVARPPEGAPPHERLPTSP